MQTIFRFIVVFSLLLGINTGCSEKSEEKNNEVVSQKVASKTISIPPQSVSKIGVEAVDMVAGGSEMNVVGEVSYDEDNVVRIYPIVSGSVEEVNVSLGDYVQRGQVLAVLLSTDITQYQRDYNIAQTDFQVAEKNLARAKELYQTKFLSDQELAEKQRAYDNAVHELQEKKQILTLYGGSTQQKDAVFKITAPISGYIAERNINQGTQIRTDNNSPVFVISDLKSVWVWANIYESDLAKVKQGDSVKVQTIAYRDKIFRGRIDKIGTFLDPQSRVLKVRAELDNSEGLLKPEMFATVYISPAIPPKTLAVKSSAIVLENNRRYVMKALSDKEFEKIEVQVGKTFNQYTEIISGVSAGEKVATDGALLVQTAYNLAQ